MIRECVKTILILETNTVPTTKVGTYILFRLSGERG